MISGKKIINNTHTAIGISHGAVALFVRPKDKPEIFDPINKPKPKGGVITPMTAERITIIPKAIKSKFMAFTIGITIGNTKIITVVPSRKHPRNRITNEINTIVICGERLELITAFNNNELIFSLVRIKENTEADAIIK
jgi:hypothetical protein